MSEEILWSTPSWASPSSYFSDGESALSARGTDPLLGGRTISLSASKLARWNAVRQRQRAQTGGAEWQSILAKVRAPPGGSQIERVNAVVNQVRYVSDPGDNWQTPSEFFRNGGDCEDYAIAKFLLLSALGTPASAMRIVALAATSDAASHAVVVIRGKRGAIVLDSLRSQPYALPPSFASRATYSFNNSTWWVSIGNQPTIANSQ